MAAQWSRLNIETVEDAMRVAEKEHKKIKKLMNKDGKDSKYKPKEETLPSWFNKKIENQDITQEEEEELNQLLKDFS